MSQNDNFVKNIKKMDKAKLLSEFSQLLDDMENLHHHDSLYDFEKEFIEKYEDFGKELFCQVLSKPERDRRKKKDTDELWQHRSVKKFQVYKSSGQPKD